MLDLVLARPFLAFSGWKLKVLMRPSGLSWKLKVSSESSDEAFWAAGSLLVPPCPPPHRPHRPRLQGDQAQVRPAEDGRAWVKLLKLRPFLKVCFHPKKSLFRHSKEDLCRHPTHHQGHGDQHHTGAGREGEKLFVWKKKNTFLRNFFLKPFFVRRPSFDWQSLFKCHLHLQFFLQFFEGNLLNWVLSLLFQVLRFRIYWTIPNLWCMVSCGAGLKDL